VVPARTKQSHCGLLPVIRLDNFVTTYDQRLRDAGSLFVAIAVQVFA
jgi:hypothetical protein